MWCVWPLHPLIFLPFSPSGLEKKHGGGDWSLRTHSGKFHFLLCAKWLCGFDLHVVVWWYCLHDLSGSLASVLCLSHPSSNLLKLSTKLLPSSPSIANHTPPFTIIYINIIYVFYISLWRQAAEWSSAMTATGILCPPLRDCLSLNPPH